MLVRILTVATFATGLAPRTAMAHGDIHVQIHQLNPKIRKAPNAELFVKRGDLYRLDENFAAALADFQRAEKLDPELDSIQLGRGRTLFEAGRHREALPPLDRLLTKRPDHPDGRILRARVHAALGEHESAVRDYNHVVAIMPSPSPDCFMERASVLMAMKRPQDALRGLDEGITRLGNLQALQLAALKIEIGQQRYDAAIARTDVAMAPLQRKEHWLTRRGEILMMAGRNDEARADWNAALTSIRSLPAHHLNAQPTRELEARLQTLLEANASEKTTP